jgi:hypothetical protein
MAKFTNIFYEFSRKPVKVCYSDIIQICGENCLTNPPPQLSKYKPNIKVNNRDTVKLDGIYL